MDHCWYGKPRKIIKLLFNIYDDFLQNYNEITNYRDKNRDNNILLRYQCDKKNIKLNVKKKTYG